MFTERWRVPRAEPSGPRATQHPSSRPVLNGVARQAVSGAGTTGYTRNSNGLEQFFNHIHGETGLRLLDLSGASQANIGFITNLGYKLYSEDWLRSLDLAFGEGDYYENQASPERVEEFLARSLDFPDGHFDGALLWDVLEFLAPPLLKVVVERLQRMVRPGSYLMAMFHSDDRAGLIPCYSYRISDVKTLMLTPRGMRQPAQCFNNRSLENLFQGFESVKFFLSRDSLREVIVKR